SAVSASVVGRSGCTRGSARWKPRSLPKHERTKLAALICGSEPCPDSHFHGGGPGCTAPPVVRSLHGLALLRGLALMPVAAERIAEDGLSVQRTAPLSVPTHPGRRVGSLQDERPPIL